MVQIEIYVKNEIGDYSGERRWEMYEYALPTLSRAKETVGRMMDAGDVTFVLKNAASTYVWREGYEGGRWSYTDKPISSRFDDLLADLPNVHFEVPRNAVANPPHWSSRTASTSSYVRSARPTITPTIISPPVDEYPSKDLLYNPAGLLKVLRQVGHGTRQHILRLVCAPLGREKYRYYRNSKSATVGLLIGICEAQTPEDLSAIIRQDKQETLNFLRSTNAHTVLQAVLQRFIRWDSRSLVASVATPPWMYADEEGRPSFLVQREGEVYTTHDFALAVGCAADLGVITSDRDILQTEFNPEKKPLHILVSSSEVPLRCATAARLFECELLKNTFHGFTVPVHRGDGAYTNTVLTNRFFLLVEGDRTTVFRRAEDAARAICGA